ncbi:MAG: mechanosensitive ion channel family protein [Chloroflexota bacterium]|nr:MAG: mechanosensitive ion channel family protein [Chloroflexota bacterium]
MEAVMLDLKPVLDVLTFLVSDPGDLLRRLIAAAILLVAARWMSHWVGRVLQHAMDRARVDVNITRLVLRLSSSAIMLVAVLAVLGVFGVNWTALAAVMGIAGLALSFSLQDLLKNFVAGVYLLIERPFRIGDRVKVKDYVGMVEDVTIRTTVLRTDEGLRIIIPNATLFGEVVSNAGDKSFPAPLYVPLASILTDPPASLPKPGERKQ